MKVKILKKVWGSNFDLNLKVAFSSFLLSKNLSAETISYSPESVLDISALLARRLKHLSKLNIKFSGGNFLLDSLKALTPSTEIVTVGFSNKKNFGIFYLLNDTDNLVGALLISKER